MDPATNLIDKHSQKICKPNDRPLFVDEVSSVVFIIIIVVVVVVGLSVLRIKIIVVEATIPVMTKTPI